tara:strand:- start:2064 stop:4127 length:2064 start_codon:yes stop_codon:yes gene_type:complete
MLRAQTEPMKGKSEILRAALIVAIFLASSLPITNVEAEPVTVCCDSGPVELLLIGSSSDGSMSPFEASLSSDSEEAEITDSVTQNQDIAEWSVTVGATESAEYPETTWDFDIEYEVANAGGVQINASVEIKIGSQTYTGSTGPNNAFLPSGKGTLSIAIPVESGTLPSGAKINAKLVARALVFSVPGADAALTFRWGSSDDPSTLTADIPIADIIIEDPVTEGLDVYISVVVASPWGALTVANANELSVRVNNVAVTGDPIETMSGEFVRLTWTWRDSQDGEHNITIQTTFQLQAGTPSKTGSAEFTIITVDDGGGGGGVFYPADEPLRSDGGGSPLSLVIEMDLEKIDGQLALTRTTTLSLDQEIAYWMRWGMDNIGNEDPSLSQPLRIFSGYGGQEDNVRNKVIDEGEINQFQQQMRNLAVTYMNDGMALEIEELIGNDLIEFERVDFEIDLLGESRVTPHPLILKITSLEVLPENSDVTLLRNFIIIQPTPIWSEMDIKIEIETGLSSTMGDSSIKGTDEISIIHRRGLTGEYITIEGENIEPGVTFTVFVRPSSNLLNTPLSLNLLILVLLGGGYWLALRSTRNKRRSALWLELVLAPVVLMTYYLAYDVFVVGAIAAIAVAVWLLTAFASPYRKDAGPPPRNKISYPQIDCPACNQTNSITSQERPFRLACSGCGRVLKIVE